MLMTMSLMKQQGVMSGSGGCCMVTHKRDHEERDLHAGPDRNAERNLQFVFVCKENRGSVLSSITHDRHEDP